ncbi:MAG: substrate-binding domain-containing protein [Eubacterium sp.]|nr:substrate-binding domain-containing protein [Eubacterium sp.]
MKQKVVSLVMAAAMAGTLLAGCGGSASSSAAASSAASSAAASSAAASSAAEEEAASSAASSAAEEEVAASSAAAEETASSSAAAADDGTAQFDGLTANEAYEFPMIVKSFQSTYWGAAIKGMDKAAAELGVTYKAQGPNSESDIADQVNMLNSAISASPKGIGLAACDTTSVLDSLKDCASKGIPVVAFDTGVADAPEGSIVCTVATDNAQAGSVAAEHLYDALKDQIASADAPVRIGEVNQDATALNIQQRGLGFINKMIELIQADGKTVSVEGNEFYVNNAEGADSGDTDVVIEVAVPAQTTVELCATEAQTILSKEDTIGIFGSNQTSAEGVIAADANLSVLGDAVQGVGFDAGSTIKAAVESGQFLGAVTQSPLMMGYYAIYALTAAANGQEVSDVPTAGYWYDASNMNDEDIAPNLYD